MTPKSQEAMWSPRANLNQHTYFIGSMYEMTLDSLLHIAIEGPAISNFPVTEAVEFWANED